RDQHAARERHAEVRLEEGRHVGGEEGHPVAGAEPRAPERRGEPPHAGAELRVGKASPPVDRGGPGRVDARRPLEEEQRGELRPVHLHGGPSSRPDGRHAASCRTREAPLEEGCKEPLAVGTTLVEGLMRRPRPAPGLLCVVCLFGLLDARPAGAQANPDFDAVTWTPLTCDATLLTALDPRGEIDLVGDALFPAAYVGRDATYLYVRYRVDQTPLSTRGFIRNSDWTVLVQAPAGDPFQYQYQLSLDGDGDDTVQIWKNDPADDLTFSPIFTDDSDTLLFSQAPDFVGPGTVNTSPLAR